MLEDRFPGNRLVGGKYVMTAHRVHLYKQEIREQCRQLFGSLELLEQYIQVVLAHELGHAQDPHLDALSSRLEGRLPVRERAAIALEIEENAWRYAAALLPEIDPAWMDIIVGESLAAYREALRPESA